MWLAIATICLFFAGLSCVWVAMERLSTAAGLDAPVVTAVLSAGLLFSFLGAAAPALTVSLANRRLQIYSSYAALSVAIVVIGNEPTVWLLAGGLAVYNFFYSFVIPFQTAWVAESDSSGRNAVLVPFAQGVGVSVGPDHRRQPARRRQLRRRYRRHDCDAGRQLRLRLVRRRPDRSTGSDQTNPLISQGIRF